MSSDDRDTSRRNFLVGAIALTPMAVVAVGQAPAEVPDREDLQDSAPAANHPAAADYRPTFFTPPEWAFINAACARLIPADALGPGAVELGVPQFIDRQMGTGWADGASWYMQGLQGCAARNVLDPQRQGQRRSSVVHQGLGRTNLRMTPPGPVWASKGNRRKPNGVTRDWAHKRHKAAGS
jgi:hypothetical protein